MRGKDVLTPKEKAQLKDGRSLSVTSLEYKEIEAKLKRYQASITDRAHILHVNSFISTASDMANVAGPDGKIKFSPRHFCRAMNRLTRGAGIRR